VRALVLFSGGQDSATCLAQAFAAHDYVETIGFAYGQRHAVELQVRQQFLQQLKAQFPQWAAKLGPDHVLDMSTLGQISDTALTQDTAIAMQADGLPNTFVPGRNLLFFTYAAALAYRRGLKALIGGMCETDYSGYPDCRDDTLKSLQATLNLGMQSRLLIETPLMWLSKAQTWQLAHSLGGDALVALMQEHTHTCYLGDRSRRHDWGYGCGTCPACELRAKGYETFIQDA
jgi:7-cyano-7-deazaguanine synthase